MMPRFKVVDYYEGEEEVLARNLSIQDAISLIDQRIEDTDGECDCFLIQDND